MTQQQYISFAARNSQLATLGTGLFPSVMIAQLIVESGLSPSTLARNYNNYFGIKADSSWKGEKVLMRTREVAADGTSYYTNAYFRVYPTAYASFKDRVRFLQVNSRYAKAGVFSAKTPEEQAWALQKAGYATDKGYASAIIAKINQYNLKRYDTQVQVVAFTLATALVAGAVYGLHATKVIDVNKLIK